MFFFDSEKFQQIFPFTLAHSQNSNRTIAIPDALSKPSRMFNPEPKPEMQHRD